MITGSDLFLDLGGNGGLLGGMGSEVCFTILFLEHTADFSMQSL